MVEAAFIVDSAVLVFSFVAFILSILATKEITGKGQLKSMAIWLTAGILFLFLRKVSEFLEDYVFPELLFLDVLEEATFLIAILCLLYGGKIALDFFRRISFRR